MKSRVIVSCFFGIFVFMIVALVLGCTPKNDWFISSLAYAIIGGISFFLGSFLRNIR